MQDHKATDAAEQKRIQDAGGFVLRGRVLGILAVSRSFGDHGLKQFVSARPFTTETEITPDCQFLALCCDGVYDVMKDEDVVKFVLEHSKGGQPNPKIAQMLVKEALLRKTTDNVTAMVIYFWTGDCDVVSVWHGNENPTIVEYIEYIHTYIHMSQNVRFKILEIYCRPFTSVPLQ